MGTRWQRSSLRTAAALAAGFLCALVAQAAPPNVTYLVPAGGQRGTTVEVEAAGTFDTWPVGVWASTRGVTVAAGKEKGKLTVTIAADAAPGVSWLRPYSEQGGNLRPFIVGVLPEVVEKEPNDEPGKAQAVTLPAVVNGRLQKAGDVDCFAVTLKKGQTLVASVEANRTLKSPMDAVLQVVSADGFVLEQNHDYYDLDPHVVFAAPRDGTYVARVFAFPAMPDSSIRFAGGENYVYRLTLTAGGFADYALPLAVSRAEPGTVALGGWNIPEEARKLPVRVPEGSRDGALFVFHPQVANFAAVRLEPHPVWDGTTPEAARRKEPYPVPGTVTKRVNRPGEADATSFVAKKGQPVVLQVESRVLGFPLSPVLKVLDADGKQLARAEPAQPNKDVEVTFTPPVDGTYRAEVKDLHGGGGERFLYRLRLVRPEPEFDLTVAADRFTLAPGKPLDVPVTVVRRNGFAGEVELTAEGLAEGVTAAPVAAAKDAKAVTLRFTAEKPFPGGAIRIVGREKGHPERLPREARAALADLGATAADLWLSPAPAPK